jgi:hypothetical protein
VRQSERERVGRVLRIGRLPETQDGGDHAGDLALVRGPVADQRLLRDGGRELDHLGAERRRAGESDASSLSDPEGGLDVARGEGALDDDDVRADPLQELHDPRLDLAESHGHRVEAPRADRAGVQETRTVPMGLHGTESDDPRAGVDAQDDRRRRTGLGTRPNRLRARRESGRSENSLRESGLTLLHHRAGPYALLARRDRP